MYTDEWWLDVQILLCNLCFYDALSRMKCFWFSPDYLELQHPAIGFPPRSEVPQV